MLLIKGRVTLVDAALAGVVAAEPGVNAVAGLVVGQRGGWAGADGLLLLRNSPRLAGSAARGGRKRTGPNVRA